MYVYIFVKKNNKTSLVNHVRMVYFPRKYCDGEGVMDVP